ncbi:MAG: hypothetical protein DRI98_14530 [Bacteroidetes bacterium]|nr:MAG: hypothetical protein DRI98_14530 [Bacteroidota bacterium]
MMSETNKSIHFKYSYEGISQYEGYLEKIQSLAHNRRGFGVSFNIENQNQKLIWQCANGHQWRASATSILYSKSWCPVCAGNHILTISEMGEIARSRGGKCLSKTYINSKTKLPWQCAEGHRWNATPFSIKIRNSWCPICNRMCKNN